MASFGLPWRMDDAAPSGHPEARFEEKPGIMAVAPPTDDTAIRPTPDGDPAAGLEGHPRADMSAIELALPGLVDRLVAGPVVLTRGGRDSFVLLPLDVWRRLWLAAPRPPVIDEPALDA